MKYVDMKYVERLMLSQTFLDIRKQLDKQEQTRAFCKHGLDHSLDVARIAQLMNLEFGFLQDKEEIYLSALLHDLGRVEEYERGIQHQKAGYEIARKLLGEIQYPLHLWEPVLQRVLEHRHLNICNEEITADNFFWFADKRSRNCFVCQQSQDCNWKTEKKTKTIKW